MEISRICGDDARRDIYLAALAELENLQREIACERACPAVPISRTISRRRGQLLMAGGVLLSTFMSALATHAVVDWQRPLSFHEAEALEGLLNYAAARQDMPLAVLREAVCAHFSISALGDLAGRNYEAAIFYLLDLAQAPLSDRVTSASAAPVSRTR